MQGRLEDIIQLPFLLFCASWVLFTQQARVQIGRLFIVVLVAENYISHGEVLAVVGSYQTT